ncbi:MAG: rod shape-determining protein MreD [Patulibacter sp.]|nr:rod shape-determining protein MreD [Patulibacter sp.]
MRRSRSRPRLRPRSWLPDHAAWGPKPVLRLGLLGLLVGLLQVAFFGRVTFLGMQLDLVLLSLLMVALLAGPVAGAAFGFGVGLLVDLIVGQTPGLSSLVYVLAGYVVGRLGLMRDPESRILPLIVGIVGTLAVLLLYGLVELLLTQGVRVDVSMVWVILGTTVINAVFAVPVHNRTKRWLLPMLPEEARRRRRRRTYGRRGAASDLDVRIR